MAQESNCLEQGCSTQAHECKTHYDCIYENNHLVTLLVNPETGAIMDANRAACAFYGYAVEQFRTMHMSDLNGDDGNKQENDIRRTANRGAKVHQVFYQKHRKADGHVMDVEIYTGLINMLGKRCIYSVVHDISERVQWERRLKESEERYRNLVELSPEAILVYSGGMILFANDEAEKLFGSPREEIIGKSISTFFNEQLLGIEREKELAAAKSLRIEQRVVRFDGRVFDMEISGATIIYEGARAFLLVLRDMTESKKEIERAVRLQEHRQRVEFPLSAKASLEKIYVPASKLSGDFYTFYKINEEKAIGLIGDVTGKGITAALNISAMRVMFSDSVLATQDPVGVLNYLNEKAMQYLDEEYVAVCCFHIDFREGKLKAAGAGINEFMYVPRGQDGERVIIKGAPIGMFADSRFDESVIPFKPGDRFCFYSDGMEFIFDDQKPSWDYGHLKEKIASSAIQDDCTWLCLKIK